MPKINGLTPKEYKFVAEYIIDLNAAKAARRAGYSRRTARAIGYENLTKPHIKTEIDKRIAAAALSDEEILAGIAAFARGERGGDKDALKAFELLARARAMFTDNLKVDAGIGVKGYQNVSPDDWDDTTENTGD